MPKENYKNKTVILALLAILVVGAVFRFYGLGVQSLWTDELASWDFSRKAALSEVIKDTSKRDAFPPAHYVLSHFIIKYFGDSESLLRLPSAIAGMLAIIAIFYLGVRLYTHREGLIAAALMAVLWYPIYYSQEARAYIFLILFVSLSTYFWISFVRSFENNMNPSRIDVILYILCSCISCYLHYFGLYFVCIQGAAIILGFFKRKKFRFTICLTYLSIALVFSLWIPSLLVQISSGFNKPGEIGSKSIFYFFKILGNFFNASKSPFISLSDYSKTDIVISISIIALISISIFYCLFSTAYSIYKKKTYRSLTGCLFDSDVLLLLWIFVPFLGIYTLHKLSIGPLTYRYFAILVPAAYLLFARSITKLVSSPRKQAAIATILVILFSGHLLFYLKYYSQPIKEQYREAVYFVLEDKNAYANSKIIGYTYDDFLDYYFKRKESNVKVHLYINEKKDREEVIEKIKSFDSQYLWLIAIKFKPEEKYLAIINKNYIAIKKKNFVSSSVWLYQRRQKAF
jgi:uncharacterized membrane protein